MLRFIHSADAFSLRPAALAKESSKIIIPLFSVDENVAFAFC